MEKRKASKTTKFGIPGAVIAALIVVFIAAANSNGNNNAKQAENPQQPGVENSDGYFIENITGPHGNIEGLSATACQGCHRYPYDDWHESPHASAMMHGPFRAGMAHVVERDGIDAARPCFACHAPHATELEGLSVDGILADDSISLEGINCFACHSSKVPVGIHILEPSEEYYKLDPNEPEFCASCHNPPEAVLQILDPTLASSYGIEIPMGNPYTEWLDSIYSEDGENYQSCLSCHGQYGTGTMHQWPENKAALIRSGYTLELDEQADFDSISAMIMITNSGTGHMYPTGDPGRLLTIFAWIIDTDTDEVLAEKNFYLGIYIDENGDLADNRIEPGESIYFGMDAVPANPDFENLPNFRLDYTIDYNFDPLTLEYLEGQGVSVEDLRVEGMEE